LAAVIRVAIEILISFTLSVFAFFTAFFAAMISAVRVIEMILDASYPWAGVHGRVQTR